MSGNATLNRSIIKRRRRGKPYDHRNMRKDWTDEWFLKNRIAIVALTNHVGHRIKEKCRHMGIMFFYGGHVTGNIKCATRGNIKCATRTQPKYCTDNPRYKTEIYEKSIKVKDLVRWAYRTFNTQKHEYVWVDSRYDLKPGEYDQGVARWKEKDLPWDQNFEVIDGKF